MAIIAGRCGSGSSSAAAAGATNTAPALFMPALRFREHPNLQMAPLLLLLLWFFFEAAKKRAKLSRVLVERQTPAAQRCHRKLLLVLRGWCLGFF